MNKIQDYRQYNLGMEKSLTDKILFFRYKLDHSNVTHFVDFGCADGMITKAIKSMCPKIKIIGYDIDDEMLRLARINNPNVKFTSSWGEVQSIIEGKESAISIISTIHEVYSYGTEDSIKQFWNRIFSGMFKYIFIRDMLPTNHIDRPADNMDLTMIKFKADKEQLREYQEVWGKITTVRDMTHFLFKYTYTENYEREVRENYFALTIQEMMRLIPDNYIVDLFDSYILPALRERIQKDFNISLFHETHAKLIIERI